METEFQTIYPRCAFLDVHKETVEATTRILEGERVRQQIRGARCCWPRWDRT